MESIDDKTEKNKEGRTAEAQEGNEALIKDYDARFEGSDPEIKINNLLEDINYSLGPDSLPGLV